MSIFKRPIIKETKLVTTSSDLVYNGLGGHSKEEIYPSPKTIGNKRRRVELSSASIKFRKVAPIKK